MPLDDLAAVSAAAIMVLATTLAMVVCLEVVRRRVSSGDELAAIIDTDEALASSVLCAAGFVAMTIVASMRVDPATQLLTVTVVGAAAGFVAHHRKATALAWATRLAAVVLPVSLGLARFT